MESFQILKNLPSTSIVALGYQIYVDTNVDLGPSFGSYCTPYDPSEEDLLKSKLPMVTGLVRNVELTSEDGKRFFHIINKNKHEIIDSLKDHFSFPYTHPTKDSRTRLIESSEVVVLDYSEKSVAIFPMTKKTRDYMDTLKKSVKVNLGLTGPNLKKTRGYILAKSNFKFKNIIEALSSLESDTAESSNPKTSSNPTETKSKSPSGKLSKVTKSMPESDCSKEQAAEEPDGEGMKPINTTSGENKRLQIWGSQEYIDSITEEIEEDEKTKIKTLEKKTISGGRQLLKIEIIED